MRRLAFTVLVALAFASAAAAATIGDLRALGYTATYASGPPNCPVLYITGYGVATYARTCDPEGQATIDSLANPAAHCNRKWQIEHPDQLTAVTTLGQKGYVVTGDQCADTYTATNRYTNAVAYNGKGAGLPAFAAQAQDAQPTQPEGQPAPAPAVQPTCLPLCPAPEAAPAPVTVAPAVLAPAPAAVVVPVAVAPVAAAPQTITAAPAATPAITATPAAPITTQIPADVITAKAAPAADVAAVVALPQRLVTLVNLYGHRATVKRPVKKAA